MRASHAAWILASAAACVAPRDPPSATDPAPAAHPAPATDSAPRDPAPSAAAPRNEGQREPAGPGELATADPRDAPPPVAPGRALLPPSVDLRERLLAWNLPPRGQGARNTCSIFTATAALEFAYAALGEPTRLSPEFVNWAASRAGGAPSDGNFFHNALAGIERFGACAEALLSYRESYDPALAPSPEALADAAGRSLATRTRLAVHWIVPWVPDRFGLDGAQFDELKRVLARGYPVAAGSAHSRLLVGYHDDPILPGGGAFLVLDSALARFDEVSYEFARAQVADAFWIEALDPPR